ncbi:hypothetical protein AKO1_002507 [Acrasis kona]|uniref:Uncharacterized protein n=1 Tax=Acrasis kona TaxID=1008807 RepID=A0AAW2ZMZ2_9EUKA
MQDADNQIVRSRSYSASARNLFMDIMGELQVIDEEIQKYSTSKKNKMPKLSIPVPLLDKHEYNRLKDSSKAIRVNY